MSNLVLLDGEREKREQVEQAKLVAGLRELLAMAVSGQIKGVCYAALDYTSDNFTVGVLRDQSTGLHARTSCRKRAMT